MDKKTKNKIILTTGLCFIPTIVGLILWNKLPDMIPTHFDFNGTPDSFSTKFETVFFIPLFLVLTHLLVVFCIKLDPKQKNQSPKMLNFSYWVSPLISNLVLGSIYMIALGKDFSMMSICSLIVAVLFIFIGNYLPKCKPNYTIGVRLPWTLHSEANWLYTHRFTGIIWFISGILILLNILIQSQLLFSIILFATIVSPFVLSLSYALKHKEIN